MTTAPTRARSTSTSATVRPGRKVRVGVDATRQVKVTNVGSADLKITNASTSAPFSNTSTFPIGNALAIESDAANGPVSVALTGTGVEPAIDVGVSTIDFGLQRVGLTSQTRTVILTNTGTSALTVSAVGVSPPFVVTSQTSFVIQPSEAAPVDLTFTPTAEGVVTGSLTITHDAAGTSATVMITGTGTVAEIDASPTMLAFGEIRVNTSSPSQPLTVRNLGLAPLAITSLTAPTGFVISGQLPISVLPNAAVTFEVTFTPTTSGVIADTISIVTAAGTAGVTLTATAVASALTADLTTLELGDVRIGEASAARTVVVTNTTSAAISIGSATTSDPQFVLDPPPPRTAIAAGETATFAMRFVPTIAGAATGQIDLVLADETAIELTVVVSGRGLDLTPSCSDSV